MNELATTHSQRPSTGCSAPELTVELAKMLALVIPTSMNSEQQELWLRAAVDALEDISPREVQMVSAEVRRTVTRPPQIVPEIARLVAERRTKAQQERDFRAKMENYPPAPPEKPKEPQPPMTAQEIARMPKWIRDIGIRVGFLAYRDGKLVDVCNG